LSSEVFRTAWKTATIIPIHKTDFQTAVQNYRPIALLPSLSKVFEKLLHKYIYSYVEYHKLLIPNNSGFRKKHYPNFIARYLSQFVPSLRFESLFKNSFP